MHVRDGLLAWRVLDREYQCGLSRGIAKRALLQDIDLLLPVAGAGAVGMCGGGSEEERRQKNGG